MQLALWIRSLLFTWTISPLSERLECLRCIAELLKSRPLYPWGNGVSRGILCWIFPGNYHTLREIRVINVNSIYPDQKLLLQELILSLKVVIMIISIVVARAHSKSESCDCITINWVYLRLIKTNCNVLRYMHACAFTMGVPCTGGILLSPIGM